MQNWKEQIPADFPDDSKVWIYQSSRPFSEKEKTEIEEQLHHFYAQWNSHGISVKGWAGLIFNRFIIFMANEHATHISGCSTDSSVHVIKSIERQYSVNLFDRLSLTFLVKDIPQLLPFSQLQYALEQGYVNYETLVFNNVVSNKKELFEQWLVPMKQSWLSEKMQNN